jgi:hypothetical protein
MDMNDPPRSPRASACCATRTLWLGLGLGRAATRGEELARLAERGGLVYVCTRMRHDASECV